MFSYYSVIANWFTIIRSEFRTHHISYSYFSYVIVCDSFVLICDISHVYKMCEFVWISKKIWMDWWSMAVYSIVIVNWNLSVRQILSLVEEYHQSRNDLSHDISIIFYDKCVNNFINNTRNKLQNGLSIIWKMFEWWSH